MTKPSFLTSLKTEQGIIYKIFWDKNTKELTVKREGTLLKVISMPDVEYHCFEEVLNDHEKNESVVIDIEWSQNYKIPRVKMMELW